MGPWSRLTAAQRGGAAWPSCRTMFTGPSSAGASWQRQAWRTARHHLHPPNGSSKQRLRASTLFLSRFLPAYLCAAILVHVCNRESSSVIHSLVYKGHTVQSRVVDVVSGPMVRYAQKGARRAHLCCPGVRG